MCFLLPHPGLDVVEDPDFDGRLSGNSVSLFSIQNDQP